MNKKLLELVQKLDDKKQKEVVIKNKYKTKNKVKKLTTAERLDRIEELLNISDSN